MLEKFDIRFVLFTIYVYTIYKCFAKGMNYGKIQVDYEKVGNTNALWGVDVLKDTDRFMIFIVDVV